MDLAVMVTITVALVSTLFFLGDRHPRIYDNAAALLNSLIFLGLVASVGWYYGRDAAWHQLAPGLQGDAGNKAREAYFADRSFPSFSFVCCLLVFGVAQFFTNAVARATDAKNRGPAKKTK